MNNAGHAAPDDLRHVRGRGRHDGGRDLRRRRSRSARAATLSVDAYPGKKFKGTVTEVGSSPIPKNDPDCSTLTANSEAINFKVRIRVDDPPDDDPPRLLGHGRDRDGPQRRRDRDPDPGARRARRARRRTPRRAAAPGRPETEEGVYLVDKDGKLGFQKVETGIAGELMIEVKNGPEAVGRGDRHGPVQGPAAGQGRRQGRRREREATRRRGDEPGRGPSARDRIPRALPRLARRR